MSAHLQAQICFCVLVASVVDIMSLLCQAARRKRVRPLYIGVKGCEELLREWQRAMQCEDVSFINQLLDNTQLWINKAMPTPDELCKPAVLAWARAVVQKVPCMNLAQTDLTTAIIACFGFSKIQGLRCASILRSVLSKFRDLVRYKDTKGMQVLRNVSFDHPPNCIQSSSMKVCFSWGGFYFVLVNKVGYWFPVANPFRS